MSLQLPFFLTLYGAGLVVGLLLARDLPVLWVTVTAWLWGALLWVLGVMLALVLGLPMTQVLPVLWLLLIALCAGGTFVLLRDGTTRFSHAEWLILGAHTLLFGVVALLACTINLARASPDSLSMLTFARNIAGTTFYDLNAEQLLAVDRWGVFLPALHTPADLLNEDYLYAAQPLFAFVLLELMVLSAYRITTAHVSRQMIALALTTASVLVMFSTAMVIFQVYYIHTNLLSAVYLLAAVMALWCAQETAQAEQTPSLQGEAQGWLALSALAWAGFCLLRVEAALFMALFFILALHGDTLPYRARMRALLPMIGGLFVWYAFLLIVLQNSGSRLSALNSLMLLAALGSAGGLLVVSRLPWIARTLLPRMEWLAGGGLALALTGAFIIRPAHMADSVAGVWENLALASWPTWWGSLWLFVIAAWAFALIQPRLPHDGVFWVGVPAFVALMILLSAARRPYHEGWSDSANRMVTHILPLALIYTQAQFARALWGNDKTDQDADSRI